MIKSKDIITVVMTFVEHFCFFVSHQTDVHALTKLETLASFSKFFEDLPPVTVRMIWIMGIC